MAKVLLSTDIGSDVDDALALLAIFNSGIDLQGIYTVNGDVNSRAYIAKHMANLAGRDTPVVIGESEPFTPNINQAYLGPFSNFEDYLVDNSFVDEEKGQFDRTHVFYKEPERVGISIDWMNHMFNKLHREKHTIFSIAPLTNIAHLMQENPEAARNIERLFVMGARLNGGLEHNIRYDVEAARKVFASDIPITVIPGDICSNYHMPIELAEQINSPAGKYVQSMVKSTIASGIALNWARENLNSMMIENRLPHELIVNLDDPHFGAYCPEEYLKQFGELRDYASKSKNCPNAISYILESMPQRDIGVADVYVPYCFLNPEKIKTERKTLAFTDQGGTIISKGSKHEVVTSLDYQDFAKFLEQHLI